MRQSLRAITEKNEYKIGLFSILLMAFLIFISRIRFYGVSYDEYLFYEFAQLNLHAIFANIYGAPFDHFTDFYDLKYYGPAYIILGKFIIEKIQIISPNLNIYYVWHALNFGTFLTGAWIIFFLGKRFIAEKGSFFASLLYLTQPLLWGHGIMNPKDVPFLVFFLAAVTTGIIAVDKIHDSIKNSDQNERKPLLRFINKKWENVFYATLIILGSFVVVFTFDRITSNALSRPVVDQSFSIVEQSNPQSILYSLKLKIDSGISNGIELSSYIDKTLRIINSVEYYFIAFFILLTTLILLLRFPSAIRWTFLSAFLLGLTMAIRVLGPAAGGLVALYALLKLGKKSWRFVFFCAGISILIMFLFWPRLWVDPINRYKETFEVMSNFPWPGAVRFQGNEYLATELPWYYLPKIISIQLTLPLLVLSLTGLIQLPKKTSSWRKNTILVLWFFAPLLAVIIFRPAMYDNFRQFLFIIPPLFIFAGLGFEKILLLVPKKILQNFLFVILLLPGIVAGTWLHPYEYTYYNALVGGTGNVGRNYETDYWITSFCEAAQYLSENAQEGSQIAFTDSMASFFFVECSEKKFDIVIERVDKSTLLPDYSLVSTRYGDDLDYFTNLQPLKIIGRGNTPFLLIRSKSD